MICDIHRRFLEAGADIIETNTFGATSITQSEFFVDDPREHGGRKDPAFYQSDHRRQVPQRARLGDQRAVGAAVPRVGRPRRQRRRPARFVAGAIGPLTVSLSNSPDADDAGFRVVTFDQVKAAYASRCARSSRAASTLLVETIFDSLNAKAALVAIEEVFAEDKISLPIMISAAVGRGGETMISAQTVEAFWNAVKHVKPLSDRPQLLARPRPHVPVPLRALGEVLRGHLLLPQRRACPTRSPPRASISSPRTWAASSASSRAPASINIAGGCCGNTPEHIAAIAKALEGRHPREIAGISKVRARCPADLEPEPRSRCASPARNDRRAHQRRRLAEVREAHQGGQVRGGRRRRAPAGRERRQRHRHLHGRGHDRRRRRDDRFLSCSRASPRWPRCPS
jgi:5-methyltetrahydrofolate--homocysteine methyltransferase